MGNTAGRGKSNSSSKLGRYFLLFLTYFLRFFISFMIVLMILFLWTEDLYDYTSWDFSLALQLLAFVALMVGLALFFYRPKLSGWAVLVASVLFWVITFLVRNMLWLGWFFWVFPLLGLLILIFSKIEQINIVGARKR
jgi:hypothetical protein